MERGGRVSLPRKGDNLARRRMICPEIWESEDFSTLSLLSRLLFIGMFSNADDEGKGKANPSLLKSKVFMYDKDVDEKSIEKSLAEIADNMSIKIYIANDGNTYYELTNWKSWQTVNRPSPSKIPSYEVGMSLQYASVDSTLTEYSLNTHGALTPKIKESEDKGKVKRKEDKDICPVPEVNMGPCVITLTLNDKSEFEIFQNSVDEWQELYPAVDVPQALRAMKGWLKANPAKRKTLRGINKFINSWLAREQNGGGTRGYASSRPQNIEQYADSIRGW